MGTPELLFGAGGIGEGRISKTWTNASQTSELLDSLQALGLKQLDSAGSYPPGAPWVTETLLGQARGAQIGFAIDSKVQVTTIDGGPPCAGSLSADNIRRSLDKTLESLGVEKVHIYYCHAPDPLTALEETAYAFDEQFRAGKFEQLGLCNFDADLAKYLSVCDKHGYVKPTVMQGDYSAVRRKYEETFFSMLKKHGIKFNEFSPLGGGFLTGKVTVLDPDVDLSHTRWRENRHPMYAKIYDRPEIHVPMKQFMEICEQNGMTSAEASLRWIMNHSALGDGDGIILGATRVDQLKWNAEACKKGPLPEDVLRGVEVWWEKVRLPMETIERS